MPTKEQILEAAATSPEAKQALEKLFPEYFESLKVARIVLENEKEFSNPKKFNERVAICDKENDYWLIMVDKGRIMINNDYVWEFQLENGYKSLSFYKK